MTLVRLGVDTAPYWLTVFSREDKTGTYEVRFQLKPLSNLLHSAAYRMAMDQARNHATEALAERAEFSGPVEALKSAALTDSLFEEYYARNLLGLALVSWSGVGDKDGEPIAPTPEAIAELCDGFPTIVATFLEEYRTPFDRWLAEGNG